MKEFKLISTQPQTGCLNVPVFKTMTNADVVKAMIKRAKKQDYLITKQVFNYMQKLSENPKKIHPPLTACFAGISILPFFQSIQKYFSWHK